MSNQQSKTDFNKCETNHKDTAIGFTMIEVIVALAILGTTMIAVFGALRTCSTAAHHTRMLTKAVLVAEGLLTEARLTENLAFETNEGQEGLYKWRVQIAPTPVENLGAIHVQVSWQEQQRQQQYELFSLIYMKTLIEGK